VLVKERYAPELASQELGSNGGVGISSIREMSKQGNMQKQDEQAR
jgi:hypothetical protein